MGATQSHFPLKRGVLFLPYCPSITSLHLFWFLSLASRAAPEPWIGTWAPRSEVFPPSLPRSAGWTRALAGPAGPSPLPPAPRASAPRRTSSLSPVGRLTNHFKGSRTLKDKTKRQHMVRSPDVCLSSSCPRPPPPPRPRSETLPLRAPRRARSPTSKFRAHCEVA